MHPIAVYALFFLSGISGLIYQVVWVREYGNVFGVTVYSAALVTAVFMCGLGAGSFFAGRWADRHHAIQPARLIRAYGGIEIVIGGLGALLAVVVPRLDGVSTAVSNYALAPNGWHELALGSSLLRYAAAAALLAPSTLLMGATLPLLIRFVVSHQVHDTGWRVGLLYGINTAGAAFGCFLVDSTLIPRAGLLHTQFVAAALNVMVGGAALVILSRSAKPSAGAPPAARPRRSKRAPDDAAGERLVLLTALALFFFGATAMGSEMLWFRFLSGSLGKYRSVFSVVLTVILVGIWLGAILGGYLQRRWERPAATLMVAQGLFVALTMVLLATFDPTRANRYFHELATSTPGTMALSSAAQYWGVVRSTLPLVAAPSLLMGLTYPLANAHVQVSGALVGRRAGVLYLANTLGNVLGVVATGFVLLPSIGSQHTTWVLGLFSCAGIASLFASLTPKRRRRRVTHYALAAGLGLALVSSGAWAIALPSHYLLRRTQRALDAGERYLTVHEDITEVLAISEDARGRRTLWTDGHPMSGTRLAAQRYMRAFSHIPLLQLDDPKSALVICFGVGTTAHAASAHPLERLDIVDMSRSVLEHARYFSTTNGSVLGDPRVRVFVNDGRHHLRMQPPRSYDLVTLEPPPIAFAGVAALYSREFYQLVHSRLQAGGFLTQWLPIYQVDGATAHAMVRAFVDVFPDAVLLAGQRAELILVGRKGREITFDLQQVALNLALRPQVQHDLEGIAMGTLTDIVGTFVADADSLRTATHDARPVTDDIPSMEYTLISHATRNLIPTDLFHVERVAKWCEACFEDGQPVAPVLDIERYLAVMGALYASRGFLFHSSLDDERPEDDPRFDDAMLSTIEQQPYLRAMFGRPPPTPSP